MVRRRPGPTRLTISATRAPAVVALLTLLATCTRDRSPLGPREMGPTAQLIPDNPAAILVGAGDIADCTSLNDEATASLLDGIDGTVFTVGDNVYDDGSATDYNNCYEPSWGRHKARTRPVPGNHEYNTPGATGYFDYFGGAAGEAGKGYYSYDLGDWHIIALNNYISMQVGDEQDNWLRADLTATTKPCKLAYYHEPLYSSTTGTGSGGATTATIQPLFSTLYAGGVDVVLNGHRHFYERLAPMNPDGQLDATQGIREFIVGTGGSSMADPTNAFPLSEVRFGSSTHGVLKLYLYSDSYAWRFIPQPGKTLSDSGSYACHGVGSGVSASQSTVRASPTTITPGGQAATITVTAKSAFGEAVSGAAVELAATGDGVTLTPSSGTTDGSGVFAATLSSTALGEKEVSATANGTAIAQTATVTVEPPTVFSHTLLTAGNNPINQTVYTTAAITPAPNTLITVAVLSHRSTGASPVPTVSGGGMTSWTVVASTTFDPVATPTRRLTIYRAMSATPGTGPLTISFTGNQSHCQWIVSQWSGVDLSGVNGAGAIVQTLATNGDATNGLTVGLAAFENVNNGAFGVFGVRSAQAVVTPGTGFTEISEQPSAESTPGDLEAEWNNNAPVINATWTQSLNAAALGVEIKAAASGSGSGVDALQSTLSAAPPAITAGGTGSTITVTARNANGNPVSGAAVTLASTGTGNTFTPASGTTDGNGVFTSILTSTAAESKTLSATANGVALSQHATVSVTAGPVSASHSTVSASPTSIAPGGQTSDITVMVMDAFDNPINGATVVLSASPAAGVSLTQPSTTDASGAAVGALSSSVAEDKVVSATATLAGVTTPISAMATVLVTPQGSSEITHTLLTAGNNPVNATVYTTAPVAPVANTLITVAVLSHRTPAASAIPTLSGGGMTSWTVVSSNTFDTGALPLRRLTIYRAMSAAPASGPLTITFTNNQSNCQWIVSQWSGVSTSGVNGAGAIVQIGSNLAEAVNGLTVSLAPFGSANNVAYGVFGVNRNTAVVTPGAGFTEISEHPSAEGTPGDLQAEWTTNHSTIDASWAFNLNAGGLGLELKAAASGSGSIVSASLSSVKAAPTTILPGGAGSTIEVIVRDASGAPITGATVEVSSTGTGNILPPPGPTDATGVYTGIFSSSKAETKLISATARIGTVTTALQRTATVIVNPGPVSATASTINAEPTSIIAENEQSTITVTVKDAQYNPIPGATVTLFATGTGNTLSTPGATDANGVYTGTLSSTVAEDKVVSAAATVGGVTTQLGPTVTVTVTPGSGVSATQSTVDAAPTAITAGSGSSTITVTVKDIAGQPVSGATVQLAATGTDNTLVQPSDVTDENGVATGTLSSTRAELKAVSATATVGSFTTELTTKPEVTVIPGPVSTTASTIAADLTSIVAGSGSSTITVTVNDDNGNPIEGATVTFAASGSGNTVSAPGLTNSSGVYQGTLSSTVPEDKVVSATATVGSETTSLQASVTVSVYPAVSAAQSTVSADLTSITAGNGSATIIVTVRDGVGQPISGATVQLAATGASNTLVQPTNPTDENGVTTGTLSSTTAGVKTVSASATVGPFTTPLQSTVDVTVNPGPVSTAQSTIGAAPTAIMAVSGSSTITVTVKDDYGNAISGASVQLNATGTGNTIVQPADLTDANGTTTGTLSSTDPGDKVVSASATVGGETTPLTATVTVSVTPEIVNITHTSLTIGTNTANQKVYTTSAIAPAANALITIAVLEHSSLGTPPIPTLSGGGMSAWEVVATTTFADLGGPLLRRLTIFRAMSATPGNGPITITSTMTLSHAQWIVSEWSGVETGGANGSGAIGQTGSATGEPASGLTVPLAAFSDARNVGYGAFGVRSTQAVVSPGAGFTEIGEQPSGEGTPGDLEAEWAVNRPSIAATWTNLNSGALGVEIKARTGSLAGSASVSGGPGSR